MKLWVFVGALAFGTPGFARSFSVCESMFVIDTHITFSKSEITEMFFKEYDLLGPDTAQPIRWKDQQVRLMSDRSPLFVLDEFTLEDEQIRNELVSSDIYAKSVLLKRNEQLLLISKFGDNFVPGFDGIIYSAKGFPVANYTLKATRGHWWRALSDAISKASDYSVNENEWFNTLTSTDFERTNTFFYLRDHWPKYFQGTFKNIVYLTRLFGIRVSKCSSCKIRKTRVVIHLTNANVEHFPKQDMIEVQRKIASHRNYIESVTFIDGRQSLEIFEAQSRLIQ